MAKEPKAKVHMIELRRRNPRKKTVDTGASLEVLLDGKKLNCVKSIQINANAGGIATVNLELIGAIKSKTLARIVGSCTVEEIEEE